MSTSKYCFFLLSALLLLAGCGPKETDSTNAKELQDIDRLRARLSQFNGTYRGTVVPSSGDRRPIPVEVRLSVVDVADGTTNDSREVTFHPELRGFFIRTDYLSITPAARRPVRVRYYEEPGTVAMENIDKIVSPTPNQGVVQMSGTMRNGVIEGPIVFTIGDTIDGQLRVVRGN